jgi:hypothetical protein
MRAALFGSPGVSRPVNLPRHMIRRGTPGRLTGVAGTFLAVTAGHHLDLHVGNITPSTLVINFDGTEVGLAAFVARINLVRRTGVLLPAPAGPFFQKGGFVAQPSGGQLQLEAFYKGSMAGIQVLGTTSADVLVSLGLGAGQVNRPAFGWGVGTDHMYKAGVMFFGGVRPEITEVPQAANQHGVVTRIGPRQHLHVVDRQFGIFTTESGNAPNGDSTHFAPLHQPIP